MSTQNPNVLPLQPDDVVPNDMAATLMNWSLRNDWGFCPDFATGEPWVDPICAWQLICPAVKYSSAKTKYLTRAPRHNGLVRLSDVMRVRRQPVADE